MKEEVLKEEREYLNKTREVTKQIIEKEEAKINEAKEKIVSSKQHIWQNISEYSDPEMYSTMYDEDLKVKILNESIIKVAKLYRSLDTSYFGKVTFNGQDIYVGLTSIIKDYDIYVYDWRAPISNLYYNFGIGKAFYDTPLGKEEGEISLKRQFVIEMGTLKKCFDTDLSINDDILQEVLSSNSDEKMKNIVSTIQKEQNEVIRYSGKNDMIIDGIAGSGKTSVALHRIAYLLYNQKNLTDKNVLIFSPNDIFTDYISNVLPELGENNVPTYTFVRFAKKYLPKIKIKSLSDAINDYYEVGFSQNKKEQIEFKLSLKYKKLLDKYLEDYYKKIEFEKNFGLKKTLLDKSQLNEIKNKISNKYDFYEKFNILSEKLCELFDINIKKNSTRLNEIIRENLNISSDPIKLYNDFLSSSIYQDEFNETYEISDQIDYYDLVGLLYLYFEINGYPILNYIKHVVIDEAQDYTPFEFMFIKKLFPSAVFTILGDNNQAINPYIKYENLNSLLEIFKTGKFIELKNSYRSSKEIIEYSNKILGLNNITSIRDYIGIDVKEKNGDEKDVLNDLISLIDKNYKRIGVIVKNNDKVGKIKNLLNKSEEIILKDKNKIKVLPFYLTKGLEFDAVISYNDINDKYNLDKDKYIFYVICTRSQHELIIYNK